MGMDLTHCKVKGCQSLKYETGFCVRHYGQWKKHGKIFKRTRFTKNFVKNNGRESFIYLYNRQNRIVGKAIIDPSDINVVDFKWCMSDQGYAMRIVDGKRQVMHHLILKPKKGFVVDHINHNRLDNRRVNLRYLTHQQNLLHRRKIPKYFFWSDRKKRWRVQYEKFGKTIYCGVFKYKKDAVKVAEKVRKIRLAEISS